MTYPIAPLGVRIRAAAGIYDPSTDPSTWPWVDITRDVDHLADISESIGSPDDDSEPSTTFDFVVKQDASVINGIVGRYTADNPESDLYPYFDTGCPIEFAIDVGDGGGWDVQSVTFVQGLENDFPSNTQWRTVAKVTCVGELQRGGVLNTPQRSAMYRTIMDRRNFGVWMFEDANGATEASSAVSTQPPMRAYGIWESFDFGAAPLVPGVSGGATIRTGQAMQAVLTRPSSGTGIKCGFLFFAGTNPGIFAELVSFGTVQGGRYALEIGPSCLRFRAYNSSSTEISGAGAIGFIDHLNEPVFCELQITQQSTGTLRWDITCTRWHLDTAGQPVALAGTAGATFSGTLGNISNAGVAIFANLDDIWISAMAVNEPPFPGGAGYAAVLGWAGNTATGRVAGMCAELGVPYTTSGTTAGEVMGPQLIDTLRANMLDVLHTDHGVLSDHTGKVSYKALSELYNLPAVITLTRTVRGQLGDLPAIRDDSARANRVTITRRDGGSITVDNANDILTKGLFETAPPDLNLSVDSQLTAAAGWYLARGLATGYRYGELTLYMRVAAEYTPVLAGQVAALQLGDRIAITSLPPQAGKGGIERIVRGRRQTVRNRGQRWDVTYSMVPPDVYQAFVLDTDRLDTMGTEVVQAVSSTATTVVASTAGSLPATGGGQSIPLDMAGEQVLLTAVATEAFGDNFNRTVSGGWGSVPASANIPAQAWSSANPADCNVNGTQGTLTVNAAGTSRSMHLQPFLLRDGDYTAFATVPVLATGNDIEIQVNYRHQNPPGTGYAWRLTCEPGGTTRLRLFTPANDTIVELPLALTHTAGATYGIRWTTIGKLHRCKVWLGTSSATEPVYWTAETEDSTRLTAGYPVLRAGRTSGNTNAALVISWDNFTVNNLQAFTLTRSQGAGVVKAQARGNPIKLWRPKGLGL